MSFTNPQAFWLLLLLPLIVAIGWPRLSYRRGRDAAALVIRLVLVVLLVFALAGVQVERSADKLAVVFLVDVSDSMSPARQSAAVEYIRRAADEMSADSDQAAIIVFGADALVEVPITNELDLVQVGSDPIRLNTDLAEAIRLGIALFPADTAKRLVILSDGRQTVGDAEDAARLAAAAGVQIDYVPLAGEQPDPQAAGPEVLVSDVSVPGVINQGEAFDLTVTVQSTRRDSPVDIQVLASGQMIHSQEVVLQQGENTYVFPDITVPSAGFVDFRVVVQPRSADGFYQNNELSAFTRVTGPPRVLLMASDVQEVAELRAALEAAGLEVDVSGPRDLPLGLAPLSAYDTVVLGNVSAAALGDERMAFLQAYVRDLGGGLVVVGGPESYGVGGYFDTPLEETLPVEMRLKDQERVPQLTMLFVLDRSGSMEVAGPSGVSNLELAKEAVSRSLDLLNDTDRVGVLSFDVSAYYVVEIQDVGDTVNREAMRAQIGALRPGGGTNIRQGVLSADQALRDDPSQLKHIILLTDGGSDPTGITLAVDRMYENYDITTSVIAVGEDYARWLEQVAEAGRGKFHVATDVTTIPSIFTAETLLATRSYISETPFVPTRSDEHPIMRGIAGLPALQGYVATSAKDIATVILRGPYDDPVLATWQYGLGRAAAFTSDASSRWAAAWLTWDGFADFWSQLVRWTIIEGSSGNVEVRVEPRGDQAALVVDARDSRGDYLNGLALEASITNARLQSTPLTLNQTAPGRYEAMFNPQREGAYFVTVAGGTPAGADTLASQSVVQTTGWVLSYSAEYRVNVLGEGDAPPEELLARISDLTGGGALPDSPGAAFTHDLDQQQAAQPVWPYFLLAAVLLLPLDVAVRRIAFSQRDAARLTAAAGRLGRWRGAPEPAARSEQLERLMSAKGRARRSGPDVPVSEEKLTQSDHDRPTAPAETPRDSQPDGRPGARRRPPSAPDTPDGESLASRLLERRQQKRRDD